MDDVALTEEEEEVEQEGHCDAEDIAQKSADNGNARSLVELDAPDAKDDGLEEPGNEN